jgi:hypothetical protein
VPCLGCLGPRDGKVMARSIQDFPGVIWVRLWTKGWFKGTFYQETMDFPKISRFPSDVPFNQVWRAYTTDYY